MMVVQWCWVMTKIMMMTTTTMMMIMMMMTIFKEGIT